MAFHKAFSTTEKAIEYVQKQKGIFGTAQYVQPRRTTYPNVLDYNGYDIIKDVPVEE